MQENDNAEFISETGRSEKKPRSKLGARKKAVWIAVGAVGVVGLIVVGILTQRFALAFMPHSRAQVVTEVCTIEDINKFNTIRISYNVDEINKLISDIAGRNNQNDDVNCVFIQYVSFYGQREYTKASEKAIRIRELVNKGRSIDSRIVGAQDIATIERYITSAEGLKDGRAVDDDGTEN